MRKSQSVTSFPKAKVGIKGAVKIILVLSALVLFILLILKIVIVPKTPATSEQMWNVMVENGYEPRNITNLYYEKDKDAINILNECIAFEKEDIHFEFFVFKNRHCAIDIFYQLYSGIKKSNYIHSTIATNKAIASYYRIYTIDDHETYNVAIFVENTVVYAYSASENKNDINILLDAINYLN